MSENGRIYRVDFGPDLRPLLDAEDFFLTETIKAPDSGVDSELPETPEHATWDGRRLVLSLGPHNTEDDTYTTIEVSSTRRFDQKLLDKMVADGSPRPMLPGRQAIFRDVLFGEEFTDHRAATNTVTTGVLFQSWRGIEEGGIDFAAKPDFMIASIAYIGGKGFMPSLANRSINGRGFFASVMDFRTGVMWFRPLKSFDPSVPHEIRLQWRNDRDVVFLVDGREVERYVDGKINIWPFKFHKIKGATPRAGGTAVETSYPRRLGKGIDLFGHRYLTADPCHIDLWLNTSAMSATPTVPNGRFVTHPIQVGIAGFGVEPLED